LPYKLNTFSFKYLEDLNVFITCATQAQVEAIKTLEICSLLGEFRNRMGDYAEENDLVFLVRFSGLEQIEIIDRTYFGGYIGDNDEWEFWSKLYNFKWKDRWVRMAAMLRGWVPGVRVSIRALIDSEYMSRSVLTPAWEH
jgi:hypothetical protein